MIFNKSMIISFFDMISIHLGLPYIFLTYFTIMAVEFLWAIAFNSVFLLNVTGTAIFAKVVPVI